MNYSTRDYARHSHPVRAFHPSPFGTRSATSTRDAHRMLAKFIALSALCVVSATNAVGLKFLGAS